MDGTLEEVFLLDSISEECFLKEWEKQGKSTISLYQWIVEEVSLNPVIFKDVGQIIICFDTCFKVITEILRTPLNVRRRIRRNIDREGLEVAVNNFFKESLSELQCVFALITQVDNEPIYISESGSLIIFLCSLEGDCEGCLVSAIGSLFTIYRCPSVKRKGMNKKELILRRGVDALICGAVVYGPATILMIADSPNKVLEFHLANALGEFIMIDGNMRVPYEGDIYFIDELNYKGWDKKMCRIIYSRKQTEDGRQCENRLPGSKAAILFRLLQNGGLYVLPAKKLIRNDTAKLYFEGIPLSYIMRAAGGLATTGLVSPLEIYPSDIHAAAPLFVGSKCEINNVIKIMNFERNV